MPNCLSTFFQTIEQRFHQFGKTGFTNNCWCFIQIKRFPITKGSKFIHHEKFVANVQIAVKMRKYVQQGSGGSNFEAVILPYTIPLKKSNLFHFIGLIVLAKLSALPFNFKNKFCIIMYFIYWRFFSHIFCSKCL